MHANRSVTSARTAFAVSLLALGTSVLGCGEGPVGETETVRGALSGQAPVAFHAPPGTDQFGRNYPGFLSIDQSGPGTSFSVKGGIFDYGMSAGTVPSQVRLPGGGIEVGISSSFGGEFAVWSSSSSGVTGNITRQIQQFTSPSIVWLANNQLGYGFTAYSNGNLWVSTGGLGNEFDTHLTLKFESSPSVAQTPNGNLAFAAQGANGHLWLGATPTSGQDSGYVMRGATSPSIAAQPGTNNVAFAFQGSNGHLWVGRAGLHSAVDTGAQMETFASPSVAAGSASDPTVYVAYISSTQQLMLYGVFGAGSSFLSTLGPAHGTSSALDAPSIQITSSGVVEIGYAGPIGFDGTHADLWTYMNDTGQNEDQKVYIDSVAGQ